MVWDLWSFEDLEEKGDSIGGSMRDGGVCRTALATPGLLIIQEKSTQSKGSPSNTLDNTSQLEIVQEKIIQGKLQRLQLAAKTTQDKITQSKDTLNIPVVTLPKLKLP